MTKVKFLGTADFSSRGINFINGGVYDISDEVAEYLKSTFSNIEILEEAKAKPIAKPVAGTVVEATKTK